MSHSPPTFQGGHHATTTSIEFAQGQLDMPAPVTDRRGSYAGEMARTQADLVAAEARAADLALTVERQQREIERLPLPLTNAADDRLAAIWERGEQIANDEGFCSEYDRLVEAIGGTPRERDFRVTLSDRTSTRPNSSH